MIIYLSEVSKQSEKYKPQIETRDINYAQKLSCRIYKDCYNWIWNKLQVEKWAKV